MIGTMALNIGGKRTTTGSTRSKVVWYLRIGLYLVLLLVAAYVANRMRGRIPMAFGLTPIRVEALSVARVPYDASDARSQGDVSVTVRIVGRDTVRGGISLAQFRLITKRSRRYEPYASTLLFDSDGRLHIAPGDTAIGVLLFSLPGDEEPDQLWWEP